jgi:outer membrane protein
MRTSRVLISVLAATLLAVASTAAQQFESVPQAQSTPSTAAPAAGAGSQIGVLNFQLAMTRTQEGQKALQELEARFSPQQQELQKLQEEIRALQEQLRLQERTLSDDARREILREAEQKQKRGTRLQQDLQDEMQNAQSDYINDIGGKMQQVLNRYGRENNLSVIFNVSAQGGGILQWSPAVDITDEVIQMYDQTYPVQTSSTGQQAPTARNNPQ